MSIRISLEPTHRLTDADRTGITEVFATTFEAADPTAGLAGYFGRFEQVFVGRDGERIVGFQFYRRRKVAGRDVHHFSLAGRLPGKPYAGMQRRFGVALVKRAILSTVPWRPVYLAGVTNNPRSYRNMHASGGRVFPDVSMPAAHNPFGEWYGEVAAALDIPVVGEAGMVPNRMAALGFGLADTSGDSDDAMAVAYDRYVDGRREDGIFTIVEIKLMRDLPRLLRTTPASRSATTAPLGATAR
jgi:hypothetical protein